jgi:glycogen debranching enzyme
MPELAVRVLDGMFAAATYFELNRMPELFCGFDREPGVGPIPYPVACAPQAWAAGSVSLILQGCLGLGVSGVDRRVWLHRPHLPSSLPELRITNLSVAGATVDLLLVRHRDDVGVNVLRRDGDVSVVVSK